MRQGYWARVMAALLGRETTPATAPAGASEAEWRARQASFEMDLREREERIAAMQKEYATIEAAGRQAAAGAGREQLEQLFKRLAAPLANLATLTALAGGGRQVEVADLIAACRSLEKQLKAAGLEQVGEVGEHTAFELALHQRMSGGAVSSGTPVTVQMPGYRFGGKVLLKALVTARETAHE